MADKPVTQDEEIVVAKAVTKKDVIKAYEAGANYYALAVKFFGSESDENVSRIREIVESVYGDL